MNDRIVALTTCAALEEAKTLARSLTEARLAACVNILPNIVSIYRWKGEVEEAAEFLLLIKTRTALLDQLLSKLRELHSYEIPELITLPVSGGLPAYLQWIDEETGTGSQPQNHATLKACAGRNFRRGSRWSSSSSTPCSACWRADILRWPVQALSTCPAWP